MAHWQLACYEGDVCAEDGIHGGGGGEPGAVQVTDRGALTAAGQAAAAVLLRDADAGLSGFHGLLYALHNASFLLLLPPFPKPPRRWTVRCPGS